MSRDLSDLRTVQTLMVSSLKKVRTRKEEERSGTMAAGEMSM